jgi:8-oxo-dGTP pyrophosphatase MutT (NUDIX family)
MGNNTPTWSRRINESGVITIHENPWFKIRLRDDYFSLEYGVPQVVILPVVDNDILLVKVKRPLICDETWELPAGGAHKGETATEAARRELSEETGIFIEDLDRFNPLKTLSEMPNRSPELLLCFMVRLTSQEFYARGSHENEITELKVIDAATVKQAIIAGELYLSAPIAVIARYLFEHRQ